MHIKIRNFGAIKEFDFDLDKDFHLIFGQNNLGKSYAISAVYLILKNWFAFLDAMQFSPFLKTIEIEQYDQIQNLDKLMEKIQGLTSDENVNSVEIEKEANDVMTPIIEQFFLQGLNKSFSNTFGVPNDWGCAYSKDRKLEIIITTKLFELVLFQKNKNDILKIHLINKNQMVRKGLYDVRSDVAVLNALKGSDIYHVVQRFMLLSHIHKTRHIIYYIPASRSGLYASLNSLSQIMVELSQNRSLFSGKIEIPSLSEPVSDFFLKLSKIKSHNHEDTNEKLKPIIEELENEIIKGKIFFNSDTKRLIYVQHQTNLKLEVSATSSMVSELSLIIAYLKYIIVIKDDNPLLFHAVNPQSSETLPTLIFIEEPEAHLHPEIQIKLIEIFNKLSKIGVKIVMTSHSNYMFSKFNNLVLDNKVNIEKTQVQVFKPTNEGSIAHIIPIDELGADDENFIDVAEYLYNEKMDLIDKLNEG